MRGALICVLLISTGIAHAEPLDTAEAFDAYTQGQTLTFRRDDGRGVFAAETYMPGNRVRWMTRDGTCIEGEWYAQAGKICFVYENSPTPQCWFTRLESSGLVALPDSPGSTTEIFETNPGKTVFECLGPKVGV